MPSSRSIFRVRSSLRPAAARRVSWYTTYPRCGWFTGQTTVTRSSPSTLRRRSTASISRRPVTVSLATTRTCIGARLLHCHGLGADALAGSAHHGMSRAGHAVLVRVADHLRDLVEVE